MFKDEKNGATRKRQQKEENDYFSNQNRKEECFQNGETPLSKEELRKARLKLIPLGVVILAWGISLFAGIIADVKNGMFGKRSSPLMFFASETHNTVFYIFTAVLLVTMFIYLFSDKDFRKEEKERAVEYIDGKKRKARNILGFGKGIYMDSALAEWEDAVTRMCNVLDIRLVAVVSEAFVTDGFSGRIAMTGVDPDGVPIVVLSTRVIGKLRTKYSPQMVYDIVRFLIGHELTHVRYKDYSKKRSYAKALVVLTMVFVAIAACVVAISHLPDSMTFPGACLLLLLLLIAWLFQKNAMNDCYRNYVSEYRADRRSAEISGASRAAIEAALLLDTDRDDKVRTDRVGKKSKTHPDAEYRIKELQRGKKWGMSEYFRYAIRIEW
ncbi:MAG: M48 family metalloprotease [Lachnospiraceae bacterium]|nr:M48 family metalloprotease [Lachnospiraceae bacterium]